MTALFDGAHPRVGDWEALEGKMLPPVTAMPMESTNTGDPRFNGVTPTTHAWTQNVIVNTPLTGGGGAMAR